MTSRVKLSLVKQRPPLVFNSTEHFWPAKAFFFFICSSYHLLSTLTGLDFFGSHVMQRETFICTISCNFETNELQSRRHPAAARRVKTET